MDVWPIRPNWKAGYTVGYEFQTSVAASRNGREQRRGLRQTPRKTVEFLCTATTSRFRRLTGVLATGHGAQIAMPEVTRRARSTAFSAAAGKTFSVESVPTWISPGRQVVLASGDRFELRTVDAVGGSSVTFIEANGEGWETGTLLHPALIGRFAEQSRFRELVGGTVEGRVVFQVDPGAELPSVTAPGTVFNGREVLIQQPNWIRGRDITFSRSKQEVDYGRGRTTTFLPVPFVSRTWSADYVGRTAAEMSALLGFFERMSGRLGEFYAPTGSPDMILADTAYAGSAQIFVEETEVADLYGDDTVHRAVAALLRNGQWVFGKVSSITAVAGQSRLNLAAGLAQTISPANVAMLCWMPVCRFASDELTIEWMTSEVAQARLTFQALEDLPPENPDDL